jgi:hypothetical protein
MPAFRLLAPNAGSSVPCEGRGIIPGYGLEDARIALKKLVMDLWLK